VSIRGDPDWRDRAAADLLIRHSPATDLSGPALIMGERLPDVAGAFRAEGLEVISWNRRALGGRGATAWPPPGPFGAATLRFPRGREELLMGLHSASSVLRPEGRLLVYGAKDEGIETAFGLLEDLFVGVETLGIGGRCRVLTAVRGEETKGLRDSLDAWKSLVTLDYPGLPREWVSYPGIFAHGHLDPGTRLLLDVLPSVPSGARILDYGCGSGIVAWFALSRNEELEVDLLDVDAVALRAARLNVPAGRLILRDGLPARGERAYDAIFSNPPFHRGKGEDPGMILRFIQEAPDLLNPRGALVLVAQRRLPIQRSLQERFGGVRVLAEDSTFRVWEGRKPL
jgi:16S rRNA (guanine1207-N2)-methyltransferase